MKIPEEPLNLCLQKECNAISGWNIIKTLFPCLKNALHRSKGSVDANSSNQSFVVSNVRFTTVPFKPLIKYRRMKTLNSYMTSLIHILKSSHLTNIDFAVQVLS